ncbi:MAG: hypothetical protein JST59_00140 [Actinobacteria bacterium]|nr:hypothetical protein [Actinomycetota bacterium]
MASLRQEVIVLKERNSQMKLAVDRANSELAEKDQQLSRKTSTFEAEAMQLRQKLDQCRRQLDTLNDALRATKT